MTDPSTRSRRSLLSATGVAVLALLAGCTGEDTGSDTETTDVQQETTETDHLERYETYLESEAITVVELRARLPAETTDGASDDTTTDRVLELTYATDRRSEDALADEIGRVFAGYMIELQDGFESDRLDATITDEDEQPLAQWHMEAAWATQFENDELGPDELSVKVIETLRTIE